MIDIKWYTVTTDNIDEFEKNFENDNGDLVFFAISVPHYQNLSLNLAEIRRYIEATTVDYHLLRKPDHTKS